MTLRTITNGRLVDGAKLDSLPDFLNVGSKYLRDDGTRQTVSTSADMTKAVYDQAGGNKQVAFSDEVVKLTGNQSIGGQKTLSDGIASAKGGIFYGESSPFPAGLGDYVAAYVSATYGPRLLAYDGSSYKALRIGRLISGSTFQLLLNADGTSVFGGTLSASNLSGTNTGDQTLSGLGGVPTTRTLTINGTSYDLSDDRSWTISAGGTYRTAVPGSPTRTGNTTFTLTDTSNTNKYDLLVSRGTVVKWTESSTVKQAMVVSATYATNTVTVTLVGDTMASIDASSLKYGAIKAKEITFAYLPTVGTGTDIMGRWFAGEKTKVHGGIAYHGTVTATSAATYDVNKNGTTMFTTKLSVANNTTVGSDTSADTTSYLDTNDYMTIDCDSVGAAPGTYATIKIFVSPFNDIYLA